MVNTYKKKIFVGSADEVKDERVALAELMHRRSIDLQEFGIQLIPQMWEYESRKLLPIRKQEQYNTMLQESDIIVFIFGTYIGKHTKEEFEKAIELLKTDGSETTNKTIIVYFKNIMIESLRFSDDDLKNLKVVKQLQGQIRKNLEQVYDTYFSIDELKYKFESELNKEVLQTISKLSKGRISTPVDSHIDFSDENITDIDIACNSGANAIKKNRKLLTEAYCSGAIIRIMINNPSLPIFNGTTTFSTSYCRSNAAQPHYTLLALEELNRIIEKNIDARGTIEVRIANFAITGQMVVINKKHVSYVPYVPHVTISDLFKVEFLNAADLISELGDSFNDAWEDDEKVDKNSVVINDINAIRSLVKDWEKAKTEAEESIKAN